MKSLLLVSLVATALCAVNASGQSVGGGMGAEPQVFHVADHPQRATQQSMDQGVSLMERSGSVSDRGEKPLWEAMQEAPAEPVTPLGDLARALRIEHAKARKAVIVWND